MKHFLLLQNTYPEDDAEETEMENKDFHSSGASVKVKIKCWLHFLYKCNKQCGFLLFIMLINTKFKKRWQNNKNEPLHTLYMYVNTSKYKPPD